MNDKLRTVVLIAVGLLALGGILIGAGKLLGATVESFRFSSGKNGKSLVSSQMVEGSIDLNSFEDLKIKTSAISIEITEGDAYKLEYCVFEGKEPIVSESGKSLTIREPETKLTFNISLDFQETYYKLTVPKGTVIDADVSATSGNIRISSLGISGSVSSTSGGIKLYDTEGKNLEVKCTSGNCDISDAQYDNLDIQCSSGSIKATNIVCSSELNTVTTSGNSSVTDCKADEFSHESSSGSFSAEKLYAEEAEIKTTSGSIHVSDSKTDRITSSCSSGSTTLELKDSVSSVDAESTSGTVKLCLPGQKDDYSYDLSATSGTIKLDGESFSKNYSVNRGSSSVKAKCTSGGVKITFD